ncbi:Rho guanine nucleotide exchange factor, partial [Marasmius crinis-equi]
MNTPQTKTEFEDELDWFAAIVENEQQRKELLATTDDDAQGWLDLLQLLAEYPDVETTLRSNIFEIMIRLSRRTGRHPRCLTIQNVEMLGAHPVGG